MKHLGDITKISGYTAPIVDCIIGGSPCQDLSMAGKRAGLDGERSGLFMEQIRIIKEMRAEDERRGNAGVDIRPRYMVWENVPGAFSSNKGEDFRIVLEETAKVADKNAVIPRPENGKWTTSGCIMGDGWSIAWRVLDSQFFGTSDKPLPQRRRRIALVADFGGHSASEILFVRTCLSGDIEPSKSKGKGASSDAEGSFGEASSYGFPLGFRPENVRVYEECGTTLCNGTRPGFTTGCIQPVVSVDQGSGKSACNVAEGQAPTLTCTHGGEPAVCYKSNEDVYGFSWQAGAESNPAISSAVTPSLACTRTPAVCYSIENHPADSRVNIDESGKVQTLTSRMGTGGGNVPMVMEQSKCDVDVVAVAAVDCRNGTENSEINGTLQTHPGGGTSLNLNNVVRTNYIVRRLTPLECERLQGFPDGWTDIGEWVDSKGKVHKTSDSARYKALGNSIALPPWKWILKRLCACYERDATMASLFDGIGGFPYIWEQLNGKGTCLWASEIEEFPMAVTRVRFGK